jgi:hypothetical protein
MIIEAFSPLYDVAPLLPLSPFPVRQRHTGRLKKRDNLLKKKGGGAISYDGEKKSLVLYKSFNTL